MQSFPSLRLGLILFVALSITAPRGWCQVTGDRDPELLKQIAAERYAQGELERAANLYLEVAELESATEPKATALFTASWLQHLSGDESGALESLTRALKLRPEHDFEPSLYNRQFELLYRQALDAALRARQREAAEKTSEAMTELDAGREHQARRLLQSALELAPDEATALYNLALLDLKADLLHEALAAFERVVSLTYRQTGDELADLRAKAQASIGIVYHKQGRFEDAEEAFLAATRADPLQASGWKNLGIARINLRQLSAAVDPLERAHELIPDDREVTLALASCLVGIGRADQAAAMLKLDLQRHADDAELWLELGQIERDRGIAGGAVLAFERAIAADTDNRSGIAATAGSSLAAVHLEESNVEAAVSAANEAVGWDRTNPEGWSVLGQAQLAAGDNSQAIAALTRASELDPAAIEPLIGLGNALTADGQLQQAEAAYLRALALDPAASEASAKLEQIRALLANERAIVSGKVKPPRLIPPKKIGLDFASIDYRDLHLRGALVKQVNNKSPAARAGLRKGDLILWIGDYEVLSDRDFFQYLKRSPPGEKLEIEYLRDGRIYEAKIQLR